MRMLVRFGIGLLLLLLLTLGLVWIFQGSIVRTAVESGGTWATGVETRVDDVSAGLLGGKLELEGLTLANPPGFAAEPFFALRAVRADWDSRSLFGDTIHVRELELDGLALRIERNASGTNYGRILDHAGQKGSGDKPMPEAEEGTKRALRVDRIVLKDVSAELILADLPIGTGPLRVTVPRLELSNFQSNGPTHVIVGQLLAAVVEAALKASLDAGTSIFPADLAGDLKAKLAGVEAALKGAIQEGNVEGSIQEAGKALDGLKDVFGGKKKP